MRHPTRSIPAIDDTGVTNRPNVMPQPHAAAPAAAPAVDIPISSWKKVAAKYEKQNSTTMNDVRTVISRHRSANGGTTGWSSVISLAGCGAAAMGARLE